MYSSAIYCAAICALLSSACSRPEADNVGTSGKSSPASSIAEAPPLQGTEGPADYRTRADALQVRLVPGAPIPEVRRDAESLLALGVSLVPGFVERHPQCQAYLEAAIKVQGEWPRLDLASIERDYHHDGALPTPDNAGVCYHMKDLVVHPATVLVLLAQSQPDWPKAQAEIAEVIQHAEFVGSQ